jgi:hypothetical protein
MNSWCVPIIAALITSTVVLAAVVFRRYFEVKSGSSAPARKLLSSAEQTLAWVIAPENVFPHEDIPAEDFDAFESSLWPWQQKKLQTVWRTYNAANGLGEKAPLLRGLINLVKKYSGQA